MIMLNSREIASDALASPSMPLDRASLLIAADEYPGLDIDGYLRRIDRLSAHAGRVLPIWGSGERRLSALARFLFESERFAGNTKEYFDPRNSYLNEVLDRRTGSPISLAILFMEISRRLGVELRGVSFPGHFLLHYSGDRDLVIDPFLGQVLHFSEWKERLASSYGSTSLVMGESITATSSREILARLLGNLKHIYLVSGELQKALRCSNRILTIQPESAYEIRDRGFIHQTLQSFLSARRDFELFLRMMPDDCTAETVRECLAKVEEQIARFH